jgi:hypothetical protein
MRTPAAFPDPERAVVDLLTELMDLYDETVTVGVGVPGGWRPDHSPHLEVAWDGTPIIEQRTMAHATVRVVARAGSTTEAKRLALLAQGLLAAHDGTGPISVVRPLTGPLPARDPDTRAEIASFTVRASTRAVLIPEPSGS